MQYVRTVARRVCPASLREDCRHLVLCDDTRDVKEIPRAINVLRSHYRPYTTVCFHPQPPLPGGSRGAIAYKLCRLLGYGITTDLSDFHQVAFKYTRETFSDFPSGPWPKTHIINGRSTDISKRAVNAAFKEVFGYEIGVDPCTYEGPMVVKSNLNSVHDGSLIHGPLSPEGVHADHAYQRLIDNRVSDDDLVVDYRVPVHGDQIPIVYLKYRRTGARFKNKSIHAVIKETSDVFSREEIERILRFAHQRGIDYGEFDVLRDTDDRIFVVDANTAPRGPPIGLSPSDQTWALNRLRRSFSRLIQRYVLRDAPA